MSSPTSRSYGRPPAAWAATTTSPRTTRRLSHRNAPEIPVHRHRALHPLSLVFIVHPTSARWIRPGAVGTSHMTSLRMHEADAMLRGSTLPVNEQGQPV